MSYKTTEVGQRLYKAAEQAAGKATPQGSGWCLKDVRNLGGIAAKYGTASESMRNSPLHPYNPNDGVPVGVPIYWATGSGGNKDGHIAIYIGGGMCVSPAKIYDKRNVNELTSAWKMSTPYWGEEINDVALVTYVVDSIPAPTPSAPRKSNEEIAREVLAGKWGNNPARKANLISAGYDYNVIQNLVNNGGTPDTPTQKKTNEEIAKEVLAGAWGNNPDRKVRLTNAGYDYDAVQAIVNGAAPAPGIDIEALARAVIHGDYGNGAERKARLGANYAAVQAMVKQLI